MNPIMKAVTVVGIISIVLVALVGYTASSSFMNYGNSVTLANTGSVRSTWGGVLSAAPQVLPCAGSVAPYCTFNMTDLSHYTIGFTGGITTSSSAQLLVKVNGNVWNYLNLASGVNNFNNQYFASQTFSIGDKIELWYNGTAGTTFTPSNAIFRGFFVGFYFLATEVN